MDSGRSGPSERRGHGMGRKMLLEIVRKLDEMARSVASEEADLIESVKVKLNAGKRVSSGEAEEIAEMHRKYLGPKDDEEKGEEPVEEDGVDEDDFM